MLNKMNEGFNKLIAYIKNSCKTNGSFMASFGVINFAFVVVLAFCIVVVSNLNMFGVFADEGHDYLADYADKKLIATYDISLAQDGSIMAYCYGNYATSTSTNVIILDGEGYALPFNARYSSGTLIKDISGDGTYYSFTDNNLPTVTTQAPSINFNGYGYVVPGENNDYEDNYFCAPWQQISVSSVSDFYVNKDSDIKFTSAAYLFYGFKKLKNVDFIGLDFSECTDMKAMFYECQEFNSVSAISSWDTSNVTDMSFMFYNCKYIVDADLNSWNVGNVKYMNGMFASAGNLKNVYVSNWDTHSLINISRMFYGCTYLLTLDVSNWDTGNIVNMYDAFDTPKLTTLDVSNWDTHSLVIASYLFDNCQNVTELDVSNWDVSHVTDMNSMFMSCYKVPELDVSNWDTSNVTKMSNMFNGCKKVKVIDLSNWDVTNVTNIGAMFYDCYLVGYLDMSDWDVTNVQSSGSLFTYNHVPDVIKTPKINPHDNLITIPSPFMHTLDDSTTQVKSFPVTTGTSVTLYKDINKQLLYSDDEAIYYKNSSGVCTVYETNGTTIHSTITCVNTYDIATSGILNAYLFSNGLLILDGTGDLSSNQTNNLRAKLNETVATTSDSVKKIVASYGGFKPTGTLCKLNYYFSGLSNLEEFYANRMDFSNVQEATNLFDSSFNKNINNTILDFSHMDLSSCSTISYMFKDAYCEKIDASYLKLLSGDDVECSYLFQNSNYTYSRIKDINMSHWENGNNISKLQYAFEGNPKLEKINFEGTDLGKSGANFTYFFKTGLATVNKTNSTFNIKEIILPKSVGSSTIDISFMTTGLCQFDKAGNKLSSTTQDKLIPQGTTDGSVYKLVGTKKLLASGKISAGTLGASIYNADFYNTGLEYTVFSSVTVAPTVYDLNNDGSLKAYYYSDSNTGGGILIFDGEGPLDKNTMPGYIADHGSDIKRIVFSDTGFKPSGDMRFLFSGLGSTTKKISFKEDPLCTINLDKLDLSNVTSTKYLFSNSYFDTLVLTSMSTINSCDIESMLSGAKIYGTLDLTDFDFTNKINAEELFSGYNIDSNTASTVNIKLPNSLGGYENEIDLPDFSGLTNKTWNGAYDAGEYMGIQPVSGDYYSKLIDNTNVVKTYSITYLKVVDKTIESNLKNGNTFKAALKSLAAQTGNNIQTITFSITKQTDSQIAEYLANGGIQVDDEGYTVMTMSGNTVTVYTSADKIYTNENSSNMFRCETNDEGVLLDPELETITTISNLQKLNTSKTTDFEEMFSGLKNLTSITINSSVNWNTSKVNDFSRMFANCEKLSSLTLPSDFVSNKTDFIHTNYMFYGCKALSSIDISGWTATKYSKIYGMFSGCNSATSITLNKNLITTNLDSSSDPEYDADDKRGLQSLFRDCSSLTSINLASANGVTDPFNFSTVTRTDSMFEGCESLTTLTLPSTTKIINTSVTNTSSMFEDCSELTSIDLSGCDMANVTKMYQMFDGCDSLSSLNLPNNFITNKVTGVDSEEHEEEGLYKLFYHCNNLLSLNLSGSDFSSINNYEKMFYHCDKLNGSNVTFPSSGFNSSPYSIEEMLYKSGFETIDLSAMNLSNLVSNQNIINKDNTYDTDSDGDKLKEIILPSNVSNTNKAMVSAPAGYAWFGYDASNNKLGTATYKQIPKQGAVTNLAKIKLEKEIIYQDGTTEYYRTGTNDESITLAKYDSNTKDCAWDISNAQDGSIMAYLYSNGLLILDGAGAVKRYISSSGFTITPWVDNGKYNDISKIVGSNNKFKPAGNIDALFNLGVFDNSFNNKSLTCIDFTNMDFSSVTSAFKLFAFDIKLSSLIGIETLNVSSVTNMNNMFTLCTSLPDLNLSGWNVSNCSNFDSMFDSCESTGTNGVINLSGWTFRSASYKKMFSEAKLNTLNISNWSFNSATSVTDMFKDATINNEIILPSSVGSNDITLPSLTGQKVWMGYDNGTNQIGNTTYAKLVNSEGSDAGKLYKLKPTTSVLFTIDGVSYKRTDYVTSWDISRDENESVFAYLFKDPLDSNELTLVFNNELLDKKVTSDLSSLVDGTDNIVKKYNGCVDLIVKSNDHVTDPAVITPWSLYDDTHTSTIEHVAFNNMIHFDSLTFMFAKLYGLDYIKLEDNKIDFELINSNNDDYSSYYAFYDDYNLEIDLDGEIKLPKELFEFSPSTGTHYNWILDFSDATFTSGNNNVIDDYDLGIRTSNYDSLKIFIPEDISSLGDYAKYAFNLDQTMFGVYDSDDNFLGYSPYMIDQNDRSFDKVISSVTHVPSYVVPCDELGIYACYELLLDTSLSDDLKLEFTYKFFAYLFNELYDATDYDILLDDIFDSPLVSKNDLKNIITSIYWNVESGYSDNLSLVYELVDYIKEERLGHTLNSHMSLIGSDKEYDYTNSSNEFTKTRRYLNDGLMILANPELEDPNANTTPPTTLNYLDNIKVNITNAVSVFNHALSNVFKLAILNSSGDVIDYVRDNDNTNAIINHCSLFDDDFLSIAEVATTQELLDEIYKSSDNTRKWFLTSDNKYIVIKNIIDEVTYVAYEMPGEKIEYYHIGYAPTSGFGLDDSMVTTSIPGTFNESDLLSSSYIEANMNKYIGIPDVVYSGYDWGFLLIGSDNASDSYYAFPIESLVYQPVMDTSFSTLATKVGNWVFKAIANGLFTMEDSSYDYNKITINVGSLSIADSNAKVTVNLPLPSQAYTGSAITIDDLVVVTYENNDGEEHILEQDKDYTLTYDNNVNAGQAKITITGDGTNVTGSRDVYFNITRALDLSSVRLLDNALTSNPNLLDKVYDGNNIVTSLNNLELTNSDNSSIPSNMKVIVNGTYDNSNAGSNKDVTLTYTYKDLSGNDIDTTYYTITDSSVTYKGNISKKKIGVTFNNLDNINKDYDKTSDINISITCDADDLVSGDTVSLPSQVHGNFARVTASQSDSDKINITLDANWYNIDTINSNYELDVSDAPSSINGLINKIELDYDFTHSSDSSNPYHYMKVFDNDKTYVGAVGITLDDTNVVSSDNVTIQPGLWIEAKSAQKGTYHLHTSDELYIDTISLYGTDKDNYFIKQPIDKDKFNDLYLEICNKLIDDGGLGTINISMLDNTCEYTGNNIDVKSKISIVDKSGMTNYYLNYNTDYIIEYYKDSVKIDNIKDVGSYTIKLIGQGNYSGSKDLTYTVTPKVIHKADIDLAEKDIVKVKNGADYYPVTFTSDELHLTYTNDLTSPSEVVPIHFTNAYFVRDFDYDEILFFAFENTPTSLRDVKFEGLSIDDTYSNNYVFGDDILSDNYKIVINDANYLIDDIAPTIVDITTEEKTYGRGMDIYFNVVVSEDIGDCTTNLGEFVIKYKIGNSDSNIYEAEFSRSINPDSSVDFDRHGILVFEGCIDEDLDYGLPKDQCGIYPISIESIELTGSSFVQDGAGNNLDLTIDNIDGIKPFDINKVNVDTRGFSINLTHTDTSRTSADTFLSEYHLEISDDLYFDEDIFDTDDKKEKELLSKLKFTVTRMKDADSYDDSNPSDSFYTKTYSFSDLYDDGILNYTCNDLLKDYDISIQINYLEFYDFDDSDDELHLGIFRKNDIYGYELKLEIDEDALTNDTGNTNIEAKASHVAIFNAPDFVLDDEDDDFNPNKYFTFVYTDALGVPRYILLAPNGDSTNGYKFINALTNEEVYFYQDDKISILNQIGTDVNSLINEFHFDIVSDLKGLVLDTPVMNIFGMDYATKIDYVFSDVSNFLRDNVINNIDKSVYDIISDLYLHYDGEEETDEFYHFVARNSGLKNIILRVRTIDDITRDVLKVINDNSKNVLDKDSDYIFINSYAKDFSIIDPNGDIGNYVPDGGTPGILLDVLNTLIADSGNSFPEGTFAKELERRNTINPITKDNLKQTLFDIALDVWNGFSNVSKMKDLLDKDPLSDSDIEEAMIAYQKIPSWVVSAYLDNDVNVVPPNKTFGYYIDKLFKLYYGESDDLGNIVTPGVIDGYGSKVSSSDNENFEVFGLINKVDKPNAGDKVFLDVRKITDSNELDSVRSELNNYYLNKSLSFDDKVLTPYDIKLYVKNLSSGNKNYVQPKSGENILVKLELDPLFYYTDFKIYHTTHKDDGTVDEIDSLPLRKDLDLTNNKYYVYFEADSFSTFTITCDAKTIVVSEDGDIDSEGKYLGGSITPNGLIPILNPNVTKTKLFTITLNNDYKAEIYKDFASSPFMTVTSNKMITLDNLDSDSDNIYLLVKYIYDPKVDPPDPEPQPDKPKDLSSATITIQVLSNKKFIDGYKDNTFRPNEYMTRAEFAKVISSLSSNFIYSDRDKDGKVATNTYSDIKDTDWYKDYVGYLTDKNILRGYSANNGTKNIYKGNSYVKRSEVSKILTSMFDIKSNDISIINYANEIKGRWYENSVSKLIKAGYLRGYSDGTIKAENYMTRAEVVALINRVVKNDYANINPALVKGYKDISKGSWYYNDIIAASN